MFELMKVTSHDSSSSKSVLFKGKHCFPLSPCVGEEDTTKDQLAVILQRTGKLTDYDMSFIKSSDALEYVRSMNVGSET